ncbi:MAG: CpsD/CapB family tyrosine-protein kinase [Desulfitobacteriaceae bacterium]|nr:CpsD/CapB family tyrosine-protein kinase [Desulfitobacteriaceae bacterium]MDD4346857.1 CpsD/CapB family tyrosine-protein kinase [Desulfitobacteriaceae bacterium]MDD4402246.1 CpsD/CapB family tyrosine-protein kinase [Desulfitobacteriaceae bacterium]
MVDSLIILEQLKSPIAEAYRTLRTNIQFASVDLKNKKIMITSSGPGEGKSFTIANLAVSMVNAGESVLIIDADLRKPTQHKIFELNNEEGLSSALVQGQEYKKYLKETSVVGLSVLTSGPIPPNPAELLGSKRMKCLLEEVSKHFNIILIDTPPIIAVTDAAIIAQEVDGVIFILAYGEVNKDLVKSAKEQLDKVGAKILGAVINKIDMKANEYHYYYRSYDADHKKKKKHRQYDS